MPRAPARAVADRSAPVAQDDKALVVFVFPPCTETSGWSASREELLLCEESATNRIRVAGEDGGLVADIGAGEYAAIHEDPGHHLYGARHWEDRCAQLDRTDCVGVLDADLQPGRTYYVTFHWKHLFGKLRRPTGRLELVPFEPDAAVTPKLRRVELVAHPDGPEVFGLRNVDVSSAISDRLAQDRDDRIATPRLE